MRWIVACLGLAVAVSAFGQARVEGSFDRAGVEEPAGVVGEKPALRRQAGSAPRTLPPAETVLRRVRGDDLVARARGGGGGGEGIIYVNVALGDGDNDGSSWENAFRGFDGLVAAMALAGVTPGDDQIWVAVGTYGGPPSPEGWIFPLYEGTTVLGGFIGGETSADERDAQTRQVVLSGEPVGGAGPEGASVVFADGGERGATLDGVTVSDGAVLGDEARGGGVQIASGSVTLRDCGITDNFSFGTGGGVDVAGGASATIVGCRFERNSVFGGTQVQAASFGGGLYAAPGSTVGVVGCSFSGNAGRFGGALGADEAIVSVSQSVFTDNNAPRGPVAGGSNGGSGGAIDFRVGRLDLLQCDFVGNTANVNAGVLAALSDEVTIRECRFENNRATVVSGTTTSIGGGLRLDTSDALIQDCDFVANTALQGPAVDFFASNPTFVACAFTGNCASPTGSCGNIQGFSGAVSSVFGSAGRFERCDFRENRGVLGGAVRARVAAPVFVACTFIANTGETGGVASIVVDAAVEFTGCVFGGPDASDGNAADFGGVALVQGASATFRGCTAMMNRAQNSGGAVYVEGSVQIDNCVLARNFAPFGAAMILVGDSEAAVSGTTIVNNGLSDEFPPVYLFNQAGNETTGVRLVNSIMFGVLSSDGAFFDDTVGIGTFDVTHSIVQGGFAGEGNLSADPLFVDAAGGNYRLAAGSPAIDSGFSEMLDPCLLDADGNVRRADDPDAVDTGVGLAPIVDRGAYERASVPAPGDSDGNRVLDECELLCLGTEPPPVLGDLPASVEVRTFQSVTVPIVAMDPNPAAVVTIKTIPATLPPNMTLVSTSGNPAEAVLVFSPSENETDSRFDLSYPVQVVAENDAGSCDRRTVVFDVLADGDVSIDMLEVTTSPAVVSRVAGIRAEVSNPGPFETVVSVTFSADAPLAEGGTPIGTDTVTLAPREGGVPVFASWVPGLPDGPRTVHAQVVSLTPNRNNLPSNDVASVAVTVIPDPDLVPVAVTTPATTIERYPGTNVLVGAQVRNEGPSTAFAPWVDRVSLSLDEIPSADDASVNVTQNFNVAAGSTYVRNGSVVAPEAPGAYRILVQTDVNNSVAESGPGSNNLLVTEQRVVVLGRPNLRPSAVSIDGGIDSVVGSSIVVRWTGVNEGEGPALGPWTDRVIVSRDAVIGNADDTVVNRSASGSTRLEVGQSYEASLTVPLASAAFPAGEYFVTVQVNASGGPPETATTDNVAEPALLLRRVQPDLAAANLRLPGGSDVVFGTTLNAAWDGVNTGTSGAAGPWSDRVRVSVNGVAGDADDRLFSVSVNAGVTIEPGGSYTGVLSAALPADATLPPGEYVLFAEVNTANNPAEISRANNTTGPIPLRIVRPPAPNLVAFGVEVPSEGVEGQTVSVCWSVRNDGDAEARGPWVTRVYRSSDAVFNLGGASPDVLLDTFPVDPPTIVLAPGAEGVRQCGAVRLPNIVGPLHVFVVVDAENVVYEVLDEADNTAGSAEAVQVLRRPLPDLVVREVLGLGQQRGSENVFAGTTVAAEFRVLNDDDPTRADSATGPTSTPVWLDRLYLSPGNAVRDATDITLASPQNQIFLAPGDSYRQVVPVTLPADQFGEVFHLIAESDVTGVVEETAEANNVAASPAFAIDLPSQPDLVASEVDADLFNLPTPEIATGDGLVVTWRETNSAEDERSGAATPAVAWQTSVYLSPNAAPNPPASGDVTLGTVSRPVSSALPSGASESRTSGLTIPAGASGVYYLKVFTDSGGAVTERTLESNNVAVSERTLTVFRTAMNLVPIAVSVSPTGLPGNVVTVQHTVVNDGDAPIGSPSWVDRVYLSSDGVIGAGDTLLSPALSRSAANLGALEGTDSPGYTASSTYRLPDGLTPGVYFVCVRTDATGTVNEASAVFDGEGDNDLCSVGTLTVEDRYADLAVSVSPQSEIVAAPGAQVRIDWTVTNTGDAPTPVGAWTDEVLLSGDPFVGGDTPLASVGRSGALAPGQSYTASRVVTLPFVSSGAYFVLVRTDRDGQVLERAGSPGADSASRALTVTSDIADLRAFGVRVTPEAVSGGERVTVSWSVENIGQETTNRNSWFDRVVLRRPDGTTIASRDVARSAALAPGGGYDQSTAFDLEIALSGDVEAVVTADARALVAEGNELNNGAAPADFAVAAVPPSNLVAGGPVTASTADAGGPLEVSWTVTNASAIPTNAASWTDEVWLSRDAVFGGDTRLLARSVAGGLGADSGYAVPQTASVQMPASASGSYFLLLRTDAFDAVYEGGQTADNIAASAGQVTVRTANLVASSVEPGTAGVTAGRPLSVAWTVSNVGNAATPSASWRDAVYLSRNQFVDGADVLLGRVRRSSTLAAGGSYAGEGVFTVPYGLSGPYFVLVRADADGDVPEPSAEQDNDAASSSLVQVAVPEPPDIAVSGVEQPAAAQLGLPAVFRWDVGNAEEAGAELSGQWEDSVFLSRDAVWDPGDTFVGRFPVTVTEPLLPGQSVGREASAAVPAVLPGEYFVVVRGDSRDFVAEVDTAEGNNDAPSPAPASVTVTELTPPGAFESGSFFPSGADRYFAVTGVEAGRTLAVGFAHDSAGAFSELYVKRGDLPSSGNFDFIFDDPGGSSQEIVVPLTEADVYFVLARASGPTPVPGGRVEATYLPFQVLDAAPTRVGPGEVSLRVRGAQTFEGTAFALVPRAGGPAVAPVRVTPTGVFEFEVTFDLTGASGAHDLVATLGVDTDVFETPVEVEAEASAWLSVELSGVTQPRVGKPVRGVATVVNAGNVDVQVGEFTVAMPGTDAPVVLTLFPDDPTRRLEIASLGGDPPLGYARLFLGRLAPDDLVTVPYEITFTAASNAEYGLWLGGQARSRGEYAAVVNEVVWASADAVTAALLSRGVEPSAAQAVADALVDRAMDAFEAAVDGSAPGGEAVWAALNARPRLDGAFFDAWLPAIAAEACAGLVCPPGEACASCDAAAAAVADVLACRGCVPLVDGLDPFAGGVATESAEDPCSGGDVLSLDGSGRRLRPPSAGECWPAPVESLDPNQLTGPGEGDSRWISRRRRGRYAASFENDEGATAPAEEVMLELVVPPGLAPSSYRGEEAAVGDTSRQIGATRFSSRTTLRGLTTETGRDVDAEVSTTIRPGEEGELVASWQLATIDPSIAEPPTDPFDGFLPRNDETGRGEGEVQFSFVPASVPTGTRFEMFAEITFDDNAPIRTNTIFATVDSDDPQSSIDPAGAPPRAIVGPEAIMTFSAADIGSGVAGVRVYVSTDGGPYRPFQPLGDQTSAVFEDAEPGRVYGFATQAVDVAGNAEPLPPTPDAVTVIPTLALSAGSDTGVVGDLVTSRTDPVFDVVSIPGAALPFEIIGPGSSGTAGVVFVDAAGRGSFAVDPLAPLLDGPHTAVLVSDDVVTTLEFTVAALTPRVDGWQSVRAHGAGGELPLPLSAAGLTVDPRSEGVGELRVALTGAIDPGRLGVAEVNVSGTGPSGAAVTPPSVSAVVAEAGSRAVRVAFDPPIAEPGVYCVTLRNLRTLSDVVVPESTIRFAVLAGDVTGDRRTNATDYGFVRALAAEFDGAPVDPANPLSLRGDVNADGLLDDADIDLVRALRGVDLRGVASPCGSPVDAGSTTRRRDTIGPALGDAVGPAVLAVPTDLVVGGRGPVPGERPAAATAAAGPGQPGSLAARAASAAALESASANGWLVVMDGVDAAAAEVLVHALGDDVTSVEAWPLGNAARVTLRDGVDVGRFLARLPGTGVYAAAITTDGEGRRYAVLPRMLVLAEPGSAGLVEAALVGRGMTATRLAPDLLRVNLPVRSAAEVLSTAAAAVDFVPGVRAASADVALLVTPDDSTAPREDRAPLGGPAFTVDVIAAGEPALRMGAALDEVRAWVGRSYAAGTRTIDVALPVAGRTVALVTAGTRARALALAEGDVLVDLTRWRLGDDPVADAVLAGRSTGLAVVRDECGAFGVRSPRGFDPCGTGDAGTLAAVAGMVLASEPSGSAARSAEIVAAVSGPLGPDAVSAVRRAAAQTDVDRDGAVSVADLRLLTRLVASGDVRRGDINGDGAANADDIAVLVGALRP